MTEISYQHIYIYKMNDYYYINRCKNIFEINPKYELDYLSKRMDIITLNRLLSKINYDYEKKYKKNEIIFIKSIIDEISFNNEISLLKDKIHLMEKQINSLTKIINNIE